MAERDVNDDSVAHRIAMQRLSVAPQTRAQLEAAMAKKSVPRAVRERVLDRLTQVGLVDDAAFAQAWVQSRHLRKGLGKRVLESELRKHGVAADLVDDAVESLTSDQEEQTARALAMQSMARTQSLDLSVRVRRLVSLLARKGYSADLTYRVVSSVMTAEGGDPLELTDESFGG
jgi:regulatory protein